MVRSLHGQERMCLSDKQYFFLHTKKCVKKCATSNVA